jgi:hypothetical protein
MEEGNKIEAESLVNKCKELHDIVLNTAIMMKRFSNKEHFAEWDSMWEKMKYSHVCLPSNDYVAFKLYESFQYLFHTSRNISSLHDWLLNPDHLSSHSGRGFSTTRDEDMPQLVSLAINACYEDTDILINNRLVQLHAGYGKFVQSGIKETSVNSQQLDHEISTYIFIIEMLISLWHDLQLAIPEVV